MFQTSNGGLVVPIDAAPTLFSEHNYPFIIMFELQQSAKRHGLFGVPWFSSPVSFLDGPAWVQWLVWLVAIFIIKSDTLFEPPVWDAAMGVFPPAIELYRSGFDIKGLLQMESWWAGGPNVHSLSLYTWFVVAVMTVTDNPTASFLILRLVTFALVAWSLVRLGATLRAGHVSALVVLSVSVCLLCIPLVAV